MSGLPLESLEGLSPNQRYQVYLKQDGFIEDEAQHKAVLALEGVYQRLCEQWKEEANKSFFRRLLVKEKTGKPVQGVYMWGGVGRGKTFLMDLFFDALPTEKKMRLHFHRFMIRVHDELGLLRQQKNPLEIIAQKLANETHVICFDEFFVSDITDAMLLGELFRHLFHHNVTLIATSNIPPDNLYRNGLQRDRFLPAIALINKHTRVLGVDGGNDYRLRTLEQANLYYHPQSPDNEQKVQKLFEQLVVDNIEEQSAITISGRQIAIERWCDDVAWFTFESLCESARSQRDYVELSKIFHTIILSEVEQMGQGNDDAARRFISLIDEFYERHVKLIIIAATPLSGLYVGERLGFEFERTLSRLQEMQSKSYLEKGHLA